ncbi:hypothetical protein M2283_009624 [Streptomyces pseudovenezuelae]|uniref:SH3b domain-containing protein n=1 Tax=Streptomyces pseudovenezuelae TaxID=67350 RepID=A0ABT6M138_9ACTN|nr:hypothetical protein [Streptomyces pseudovenezuelae]
MAMAALSLAIPGAAGATDNSASAAAYSYRCATGYAESLSDGVKIRTAPINEADVLVTVKKGNIRQCAPDYYVTGARYNGCGVYGASAWIYLWTPYGNGYSAMTCWADSDY